MEYLNTAEAEYRTLYSAKWTKSKSDSNLVCYVADTYEDDTCKRVGRGRG